ncbi:hypothetical protein GQ457_03G030420 [Hibiscus cannabinus]
MREDQKSWDEDKLRTILSGEEVKAILSIPIVRPLVKDSLLWVAFKDGVYSVQSGYWFLNEKKEHNLEPSTSNDLTENKTLWKSIWGLKVPSKIRSFLWKMCHNIVPTKSILVGRFHGTFCASDCCPRCGDKVESIGHLAFFCPFARAMWRASSLSYSPSPMGSIIAGHSTCLYVPSASAAEESAIRLGVEMALSFDLDHIIFESNCKQVVLRLTLGVLSAWESPAIEEDILCMTSSFLSASFYFISITFNRVADWVVKNVLNGSCLRD